MSPPKARVRRLFTLGKLSSSLQSGESQTQIELAPPLGDRFALLRYFSVVSFVALAAVSVALISLYRQKATRQVFELGERQNAHLTQIIARSLWDDFAPLLDRAPEPDDPQIRNLERQLLALTDGLPVLKVKIFNLNGLTVYSSDPTQLGEDKQNYPGFLAAKSGEIVTDLEFRESFRSPWGEVRDRDLITSYVPVRNPNGQVVSVFEMYNDVTPLVERSHRVGRFVTFYVVGILSVLYLILLWLVRRADRIITQQHQQLLTSQQQYKQQAETLQKMQATLIQNEKLSSLGRMVAGVAHEINNPVSFIHGNIEHVNEYVRDLLALLELYQSQYPQTSPEIVRHQEAIDLEFLREDLPKCLASMQVGTDRIREIVLSLRIFSRLDRSGLKTIDLHEYIKSTLLIFNNRTRDRIEVVCEYGELPPITCHPVQLGQVFNNLIGNAIDTLEERLDRPPNETWKAQIHLRTKLLPDDNVGIWINDNGLGIPADICDKIFDPFFTTKPVGKGTGLGLSTAYEVVQRHGGSLSVSSQMGEGTEFAIVLPQQQALTSQQSEAAVGSSIG